MPEPANYPDAALRASREPVRARPLTLIDGALPPGLAGHLFVMSTVGSVDSGGAPYPDDNDRPTVINGDGMVWRFDFAAGPTPSVAVSSEIVKPPDYYYDELTRTGEPLDFAGFADLGMLRASLFLGTRNFANTALVPLPARDGAAPTRLVACYDAGPPVELDPATLETLAVVGRSWDPEALDGLVAFPPILATAHPIYDAKSGQLFAVNYGRSTLSMIETVPFFETLAFLPERLNEVLGRLAAALGKAPFVPTLASAASRAMSWATHAARGARCRPSAEPAGVVPKDFLDLVVWTGEGDITRLPVIDMATGKGAVVEQSMHQIAVTRRYVLLLDTNFKLRFDQFYNNPFPWVPAFERLLRTSLASQQGATSNLWVIRRDAVDHALASGHNRAVPAFKVPLLGAVHFLADYDDDDGIRIQCAHGNALDIAEWVRKDDQRLSGTTVRTPMHGMVAGAVDVSQLGDYTIDPLERRVVRARRLADDRLWGIALYAARGVPAWGELPARMRHVFWFSTGLWEDTYTLFIRALYAHYPERLIPLDHIDRLVARGGRPSTLVCVDTDAMSITDTYTFARGVSLSSPQFVPDPDRSGDRGGWITAVVWTADASELWIFDAAALAQGPLARLAVPATLGFSLHSAWLPDASPVPRAAPDPLRADTPPSPEEVLRDRLARLRPRARQRLEGLLAQARARRS